MIHQYQYNFKDLGITTEEVEQMLGYAPNESPDPFSGMIREAFEMAPALCDIRGGFRISEDFSLTDKKDIIKFNGTEFAVGKKIGPLLQGATSAALFICTAGMGISEMSKTLMNRGQLMEGYVLDVLGSITVEKAMDQMQDELAESMFREGLGITNRYSPGYCGWKLEEQHLLFPMFPDNFCGVTLSDSALMNPVKSISGVIAIGPELKPRAHECQLCGLEHCIYRHQRATTRA